MKTYFKHYYPLTDEEMNKLWDECIFVFDTNALLDVYRFNDQARIYLLKIMTHFKERLWIPYQVAKEYQNGRLGVIDTQINDFSAFADLAPLKAFQKSLQKSRPLVEHEKLSQIVDEAINSASKTIDKTETLKKYRELCLGLHQEITQLFDNKVGEPYSDEDLVKQKRIIDERYKNLIPPGYADLQKLEKEKKGRAEAAADASDKERHFGDAYGDALIWQQLLAEVKSSSVKGVIFVSADVKEDWWHIVAGDKIGPRVELVREMLDLGALFHLYRTEQFVKYAAERLGLAGQDSAGLSDALKEIAEVSEPTTSSWSAPVYFPIKSRIHYNGRVVQASDLNQAYEEAMSERVQIMNTEAKILLAEIDKRLQQISLKKGFNLEGTVGCSALLEFLKEEFTEYEHRCVDLAITTAALILSAVVADFDLINLRSLSQNALVALQSVLERVTKRRR